MLGVGGVRPMPATADADRGSACDRHMCTATIIIVAAVVTGRLVVTDAALVVTDAAVVS